MSFNKEIKADYALCTNQPLEYKKKVDGISDLLGLKGKNRLKNDNCAAYIIGRPDAKFVLFSLNPGYVREWSVREDTELRQSWEVYQRFFLNFFKHNYSEKSQFYNGLGQLLCGLSDIVDKWECFDANLLNLELIPYHSEGLNIDYDKLSGVARRYLKNRFEGMLEFARSSKLRLMIFNGKIFYVLLDKKGYLDMAEKINIVKNFNINLFEMDNVPCVLFEKFLGSCHYEGLKSDHISFTIPNLIRQRFGEIK